eukprot:6579974-Prymnesium_polylepis.1
MRSHGPWWPRGRTHRVCCCRVLVATAGRFSLFLPKPRKGRSSRGFRAKVGSPALARTHPWLRRAPDGAGREL